MKFQIEKMGEVTVVLLPGDVLDANNTETFKNASGPLLERDKKIVFDMSKMRFIDSSGCGALLSCLRKIKGAGGELKLCGVAEPVLGLFKLIRMDRVFSFFDTREEAVKAFEKTTTV